MAVKRNLISLFSKIMKLKLEPNLVNSTVRTAAMYLVEHGRYFQLKDFVSKYHINVNFKNIYGETLVSVLLEKYYSEYNDFNINLFTEYNYLKLKICLYFS